MRHLKRLYDEVSDFLAIHGELEKPESLGTALKETEGFLLAHKAFEYEGKLKFRGSTPHFSGIGTDMDDMMKAITGETVLSKIDVPVHVYMLVGAEQPQPE